MTDQFLVAGIDFGTTYSGWSYSFKHEFDLNPTNVATKHWHGEQLVSSKAPTCVLIEPDGKTFSAFGNDAETKYSQLAGNPAICQKWYFFRRFKMKLYNKTIKREMEIEDETGKKVKATTVFAVAICYLKNDFLSIINDRISGVINPAEIVWVLTVPAIWDDGAKQFMREAAVEAGIPAEKLTIALEPESASIYCRNLQLERSGGEHTLSTLKSGTKFLVVDAGGGTVDITVQEITTNGAMKNIYKASGGDWGGTKVDDAYIKFLADVVGNETLLEYKRTHMEDYLYLISDFEVKKRAVNLLQSNITVTLRISVTLSELVQKIKGKTLEDLLKESQHSSEPQIDSIIDHVSGIVEQQNVSEIEAIVLVGGFSKCLLLQQAFKSKFKSFKIIVPNDGDLAVLKGAVIFGHKPELISQRVSRYTYGVESLFPFIENVHKESYKVICEDGKPGCEHLFDKHITSGQYLDVGEAQVKQVYTPSTSWQTYMPFPVYCTLDQNPMYTTDDGCHYAGTLTVPFEGSGLDREVDVRMIYGGTEIEVEATEVATGKVHRIKVDFLS
ncbi:heat shock 70 kDa protein 12A-like isoform X2 [Mya arenaria]|uniref:heat shock 70 kDa protein 12A-like isoform X2 n=1 Tax=Mya arenaria TaxID=6604 RepID=UPI0022E0C493|nr:heat shock 70 kDa protein 12A-like isoform X2 [Mya arenaria]